MMRSLRQHEVLGHELRDHFLPVGKGAKRAEQGHFDFSEKCTVVVALIGKQNIARVHAQELNLGEPVNIDLLWLARPMSGGTAGRLLSAPPITRT